MNIEFSMPELLVVFSLLMYSQSFTFALVAFSLGLTGRMLQYIIDYGADMKKAESINENLDEAANVLKNLFGNHGNES
jgi:hypothetical protein